MKKLLLSIYLLISFVAFSNTTSLTTINWEEQILTIKVQSRLDDKLVLPEAKIIAKDQIASALPIIVRKSMQSFFVNSSQTVEDFIYNDINTLQKFEDFTQRKYREKVFISQDFKYLNAEYVFPVFPNFASFFVKHSYPFKIQQSLTYTPTAKFTGIIIYAAEALPVFGKTEKADLELCLFPKILSETGELVFHDKNIDPGLLKEIGPVKYASSINNVSKQIVGDNPLNIVATAIYGTNKTDIVIPDEYAEIILSKKENIDLLKNGRITIICNKEKIIQSVELNNI